VLIVSVDTSSSTLGSTRGAAAGAGRAGRAVVADGAAAGTCTAPTLTRGIADAACSICARPSPAIASTSTPSGQGRVDSTTASSPKAWRAAARASRDVRAT
jgi:hypothetical protein